MINFKQLITVENAFKGNRFYRIDDTFKSRRFVIPDIHGCYDTFVELLNQINFGKDDFLFLLGDYINRGKKSGEVLDKIIELIKNDYRVFPLLGNHEHMLLEKHLKDYTEEELKLPRQFLNKGLLNGSNKIKNEYLGFISNLPYYYELTDYYIVHAGFNLTEKDFLNDYLSMIWLNEMEIQNKIIDKRIIIGHKTKSLNEIKHEIENQSQIIHLDNGCVYKSNPKLGNLICFDLDTNKLFIQKNID